MWKTLNPKSKSEAEIMASPTEKCFSSRLKLRGLTETTVAEVAAWSNALRKLAWLSRQLGQVGERQSSKSAMKVTAPAPTLWAISPLAGGQASMICPSACCDRGALTAHPVSRECSISGRL